MAVNFPDTPSVGQVHSEGGANWRWSGYAWRRIPDPGAKGEPGSKGDKGQKGEIGLTGSEGDKGIKGEPSTIVGDKGDKGQKGIDGTGSDGSKGDKGIKGEPSNVKGQKGEVGNDGSDGDKGQKGEEGAVAAKGQKGEKGEVGDKGDKGQKGVTGSRTFTVTNSSASAYVIDGSNNPTLTLVRGFTYTFNVNATGHPFFIKTSAVTGLTNQYTNGVTNNGVEVGTLTFAVPYDAPNTLYYICRYHGSMQGTINIVDLGVKGDKGDKGQKGEVGDKGIKGDKGDKGQKGQDGNDGTGIKGNKGEVGNFGGATFDYTFSSSTGTPTDLNTGRFRFNNSSVSSATVIFIDDEDDNGTDIQPFLRTIDDSTSTIKGHVRISNKLNADDFAIFTISSASEQSGFHQVNVGYVSGSATSFSNGEDIIVTFARTGDQGEKGQKGQTGADNSTKGEKGAPGADNSTKGDKGDKGDQGSSIKGEPGQDNSTKGEKGAPGADNSTKGQKGDQGQKGQTGADNSTKGQKGQKGQTGADNSTKGQKGEVGNQGTPAISNESASNWRELVFINSSSSTTIKCNDTGRLQVRSSDGAVRVAGDITAFYSSDVRLKKNISSIQNSLDKVISISGNTFEWNDKSLNEGREVGVLAQEIEKLGLPNVVTTRENGFKAVRYEKLVPLLIEAIKELKSEVDDLKRNG